MAWRGHTVKHSAQLHVQRSVLEPTKLASRQAHRRAAILRSLGGMRPANRRGEAVSMSTPSSVRSSGEMRCAALEDATYQGCSHARKASYMPPYVWLR